MAVKKTLEEFIKDYVDKKIEDGEMLGIGDYTATTLSRPDESHKAFGDALISLTGGAEYGRQGERLAERGLSDSGYARYLSEIKERKKSELMSKKGAPVDHTDSGYGEYLAKYVSNAESLYAKENESDAKIRDQVARERERYENLRLTVSNKIVSEGLINYDRAYDYAISMGLSDKDASVIARESSETARKNAKLAVLERIVTNNLSPAKAFVYAQSYGLSEEDATVLSDAARKITQDIENDEYSKSYLDYLREQEEIRKNEQKEKK